MLPRAASEFYASQQAVTTTARNEVRRLWRGMGDDLDASWRRVGPQVFAVIAEGQAQMALQALTYNHDVLGQLDIPDRPMGEVVPGSFAGMASDGRPLETLTEHSVVRTKVSIREGATTQQALSESGRWLQLVSQLQVADAARLAVGVGTVARTNIIGNVRVLNPPVCQRCAVLGGRFYRWSDGFDRHPGDDCTMMPARNADWAKAEGFIFDPMDAYRRGEIKDLNAGQIEALENGADIGQVVNAYRGMSATTPALVTPEGISRRGIAGKSLGNFARETGARYSTSQTPRLTPEAIYQLAGNRTEAIALLRTHGYIT